MCVGAVDLTKQNSITQQILAQYLQKRLVGTGRNVHQQLTPNVDNNRKYTDNPYNDQLNEEDLIEDAQTAFYQGQKNICSAFKVDFVNITKMKKRKFLFINHKIFIQNTVNENSENISGFIYFLENIS